MLRRLFTLSLLIAALAAAQPQILELYPGGAPGAPAKAGEEVWEERGKGYVDRSVLNVHTPTITIYPAPAETSLGAAVIIAPGGGYHHLAIDKEGHDVAKWMSSIGVTGVVLKYRLPRTEGGVYTMQTPLDDIRQAIRLVRKHAKEWHLDSAKIGVMGFSAGGDLAARASTLIPDPEAAELAPNFTILGYVGGGGKEVAVHAKTPPAFLVHAADDRVDPLGSVRYFEALEKAGIPCELHIYSEGGHGFGILERGLPVSTWSLRLKDWMRRQNLVR
jgi:acetyl esterase/lipase